MTREGEITFSSSPPWIVGELLFSDYLSLRSLSAAAPGRTFPDGQEFSCSSYSSNSS